MKLKKVTALIICAIICFSAAACSTSATPDNTVSNNGNSGVTSANSADKESDKKEKSKSSKTLSLYFSYSDSLDPYKAESAGNRGICSLLFDSLVKLDNDLNPQNLIASDISIDGKEVAVSINSYKFSDGSYITTDDVIYSIERCKKAKVGDYVNQLENIKSYSASGGKIYITLKRYDKNAACLLDFPILKKGTADKTNDDGKAVPPVGSGRYVFVDNKGEYSLKANENYFKDKPVNTISLKNIPDYDALEYLIRSSSIDVYYSGFDAMEMPELKGASKSVNLTNLVYIGINQKSGTLNDKNIRKALSLSADRTDISEKCYYSNSKPALSLYNEGNNIIKDEKNIFNLEDNVPSALEYLKKSGFSKLDKQGYYQNESGEFVELSLLYNKENNIQSMVASNLVKHFKACGIKINLNGLSVNDYKTAIKKGDYQLYVAEVRLTKSFDYSNLLSYPKNIAYNYKQKDKKKLEGYVDFSDIYENYMKGEISVKEMLDNFSSETPFIPLVFRLGTVSYSENFSKELISSISDPYYNIEKIYLK
ncbi:MAG: ABC transporter substrate-binding protein [Acutalibacteraceae bacterium]|nr:ABC transporter substrate-binding protein [Acutalibacteraceae bacterium]